VHCSPREATPDEILRVHPAEHGERLRTAARRAPSQLDADTFMAPRSEEIARLAAGASAELALRVAAGDFAAGFAAVRPPGHHAETRRAMGFCLYNNAAIAVRALQAEAGVERVLLFDWDVHHGNGSQQVFDADPSVLYASLHQWPHYPGSGDFGERGSDAGTGATLNVPLPAGCGDAEYLAVCQRLLVPAAEAFRPEIVIVSSGFDAHRDDPLGSMQVTGAGFGAMARVVRALADAHCGGRLVVILEGGYALTGLRESTAALLDVLLSDHASAPPDAIPAPLLDDIVDRVSAVHGHDFSSLARL
jgi:acetoin utilization deacetylase AcuC-like enzyme